MKIPCEYCGQMIPETEQTCPYCGAANKNVKRAAYGVPTTIEELRAWCKAHNLPLQDMRVFIGEDYRGAKAFGIYKDEATGNFVVYKNKADGTRAVRYEGNDEAYAVNELYLKIKERVDEQKRHLGTRGAGGAKGSKALEKVTNVFLKALIRCIVLQAIIITLVSAIALSSWFRREPSSGYYDYQGSTYYYDNSDWYEWDNYIEAWSPTQVDRELKKNADDYYQTYGWREDYEAGDFKESSYYGEKERASDDWDSDYDWDSNDDWDSNYDWDSSDSWDSGYDDWDSDW